MALSGTHILCGYAGGRGFFNTTLAVFNEMMWSQTMSNPGTTTNSAPASNDSWGDPLFRVHASQDIYIAVGGSPDPTSGARMFVPANMTIDVFAAHNDKLAWVTA